MISLDNTEFIVSLQAVTAREGRESVETHDKRHLTPTTRHFLIKALEATGAGTLPADELLALIDETKEYIFRDVWDLAVRAYNGVQADMSYNEWVAAGEPVIDAA